MGDVLEYSEPESGAESGSDMIVAGLIGLSERFDGAGVKAALVKVGWWMDCAGI